MKKVEIIIPARNESEFLEKNIRFLYDFLEKEKLPFDYTLHIVESSSQDNTFEIAKSLSKKFKKIKATHFDQPGRDYCLRNSWINSDADILLYTDADISTHPRHLKQLIEKIEEGNDIAIGSRLMKGSILKREKRRVFMSNIYNRILLPIILPTGVRDAQCGSKAITQKVAKEILPKLEDHNGFLDTELLAVAHHKKLKIAEIPVEWADTRKSTMSVWKNIPDFLKNIIRIRIKIISGFYD